MPTSTASEAASAGYVLSHLEIENFKSYKGHHVIGPFKQFSAIVGPNGSGKSNLMDAISFVLGEKKSDLRVKRLSELIHGAPIDKPVAKTASVTIVFKSTDESDEVEEISFTRNIKVSEKKDEGRKKDSPPDAVSECRVDGKVVTAQQYNEELEKLGISIRSKNFLVFQGQVEQIAMKTAKDRTVLFEEMSRSIELKDEYDAAKEEMDRTESEYQDILQKRKGVYAQKKEAKMEKDEAEKYQSLKNELAAAQIKAHLFQLLFNENQMVDAENDLGKKQAESKKIQTKVTNLETKLKTCRQDQGKTGRDMTGVEQLIKSVELDLVKAQPEFIKAKEASSHASRKVESTRKNLASAKKLMEDQAKELDALQAELATVEKKRKDFEKKANAEAQKGRKDVPLLEAEKLREYRRLKEDAARRSGELMTKLDKFLSEERRDNEAMEVEQRRRRDLLARIHQKQIELDENIRRRDKLSEHLKASEAALAEAKENESKMENEIYSGRKRLEEVTAELEQVVIQLNEVSVDQSEVHRQARRMEIVDMLKARFEGKVHGRLIDLCSPTDKKYTVAVTKVFAGKMENIVCDTEETARECIEFLREQRLERETFMPLSYVRAKPIDVKLREIREPRNVKLLIDVMRHEPSLPVLQKALIYACGNALVCDDVESARTVAFNLEERHKAVSLDGTLFQKSGVISGGSGAELRKKAKQWDDKDAAKLRARRDKLKAELPEVERYRRREADIATVRTQAKGIDQRIAMTRQDFDVVSKHIQRNETEIGQLRTSLANEVEARIADIQRQIDERVEKQVAPLRKQVDDVDDTVFASFCKSLGVANIRVYEQTHVKAQEELDRQRLELDELTEKLSNQIEFERSKKGKTVVDKLTRDLKKDEDDATKTEKKINELRKQIEDLNRKLDQHKSHRLALKSQFDEQGRLTDVAAKEVANQERDLQAIQRIIAQHENRVEQLKGDRHTLLRSARLEEINIPLSKGTLDSVPLGGGTGGGTSSGDSDEGTAESYDSLSTQEMKKIYEIESKIEIDYDDLSDEHLDKAASGTLQQFESKLTELRNSVADKREQLAKVHAPNMKAMVRLGDVQAKVSDTETQFKQLHKSALKAKAEFETCKAERLKRFQACLSHVSESIDGIYKTLARNAGAQAEITLENPEEPYLGGILYQVIAPGKRYRPMDNLSGGEKTIAALALLFALHSYKPAPFFVLDEIDAALDNTNIAKVSTYIRERCRETQFVVISLKEEFFSRAEALIGICPIPGNDITVSQVLTVDLTKFVERVPQASATTTTTTNSKRNETFDV